jgi:dTDP-4-dehydrorhamnose reductase
MQVRDWLYVRDHCSAIRAVLAARPAGRDLQRRRLERKAQHRHRAHRLRAARRTAPDPAGPYARLITYVKDRPGHDRRYAIDARKIERELGWRPAETFDTGIRKTVQWYLANQPTGWPTCRAALPRLGQQAVRRAMKILLLGKNGQVGWELQRALAPLGEVVACDFDSPATSAPTSRSPRPARWCARCARPHRQCRRHTAVDKAESEPDAGARHQRHRARRAGRAKPPRWAPGWCTTAPTTCSTAAATAARRRRTHRPAERLRPHQARRRAGHPRQRLPPPDPAHQLGLRGARRQLRAHHAALAAERDELTVIDDQIGAPTGADLLADVTAHAARAAAATPALAGTYHCVAGGETSWHGYARFVIEHARAQGPGHEGGARRHAPIPTSAYPTPARRPLNSRLDTRKLQPPSACAAAWQQGVERMLTEIL